MNCQNIVSAYTEGCLFLLSEYMTSLVACYFKYQAVKEFHMLACVP